MNHCSAILALLVILILAATAGAALIDNGTFTSDTATGLDWLDMSFTDGLSYNQTLALISGGSLSGWRFATSAEFGTLIDNAVGAPYTPIYTDATILTQMQSLTSLFGSTYAVSTGEYVVGYVDSTAIGYAHGRQFGWNSGGGYVRPDSDGLRDRPKDSGNSLAGGFLVRAAPPVVPEPASLAIWSLLGLTLGAGWWRRRKRAD